MTFRTTFSVALALVATPLNATRAETIVPRFVSSLDLKPVAPLSAGPLAILHRRIAPVAAAMKGLDAQYGDVGRAQPRALRLLARNAALTVQERKAVMMLIAELRADKAVEPNTTALRDGLRDAVFLDTAPTRGNDPRAVRLRQMAEEFDQWLRQMPAGELDIFRMEQWNGIVTDLANAFEEQRLETGDASQGFVLRVWEACETRNWLASEMPAIGEKLDEYWRIAKSLGAVQTSPAENRADEEEQTRAAEREKQRETSEQYARHDAWVLLHTVGEERDCSSCPFVPAEERLLEYLRTGRIPPSRQFAGATPEAGNVLAAWMGHILRAKPGLASLQQRLLLRFPEDSLFIKTVFPLNPTSVEPLGPSESMMWSLDATDRARTAKLTLVIPTRPAAPRECRRQPRSAARCLVGAAETTLRKVGHP